MNPHCHFCKRSFGSIVKTRRADGHYDRPRLLVESYFRLSKTRVVQCCQLCEKERNPRASERSSKAERDAAAQLRAEWRRTHPRRRGNSPGRPRLADAFSLADLPDAKT